MNYEWQLYVIVALSVIIGMLIGMLIGGGRRTTKAGGRSFAGAQDAFAALTDNGYDAGNYINQATETIEVEGQTLYVLHRPC